MALNLLAAGSLGAHSRICKPAAQANTRLQVGLLYDQEALDEAAALIADWTTAERAALRTQVPRMGMTTPFRGGTVKDLSQRVVAIAKVRRFACARSRCSSADTPTPDAGWSAAARPQ